MPDDFHTLYAKALAARLKKCKCKDRNTPELACPIHKAQAQAALDREQASNAPLADTDSLTFDILGFKLHGSRTVYFAALNCHQTRNGKLQVATHLAVIREHGKPLAHARHRFELYPWPMGVRTVGEVMDETPTMLEAMTPAFMFHHKDSALNAMRKVLADQI